MLCFPGAITHIAAIDDRVHGWDIGERQCRSLEEGGHEAQLDACRERNDGTHGAVRRGMLPGSERLAGFSTHHAPSRMRPCICHACRRGRTCQPLGTSSASQSCFGSPSDAAQCVGACDSSQHVSLSAIQRRQGWLETSQEQQQQAVTPPSVPVPATPVTRQPAPWRLVRQQQQGLRSRGRMAQLRQVRASQARQIQQRDSTQERCCRARHRYQQRPLRRYVEGSYEKCPIVTMNARLRATQRQAHAYSRTLANWSTKTPDVGARISTATLSVSSTIITSSWATYSPTSAWSTEQFAERTVEVSQWLAL